MALARAACSSGHATSRSASSDPPGAEALTVRLDLVQTVAFAGLALFAGHGVRSLVPPLSRYNVPAPVAGGLPVEFPTITLHESFAHPTSMFLRNLMAMDKIGRAHV